MAALLGTVQDENRFGKGQKIKGVIDLDGILAYIHPESGEGDDRVRTSAATAYFGYTKTENQIRLFLHKVHSLFFASFD